jgi:hypothetical protein
MLDDLPDVIKKSSIALVTGGITFLVTNLTNLSREWVLLFSCFIAGVILVAQFLVDFEDRLKYLAGKLDEHNTAMEKLVEKRISDSGKVVELFGLLERASVDQKIVTKFLRHAIDLDNSSPLLYKFAHAEIERVSDFLKGLSHGNITYTGEDHDWLLELTESAQATIDATSLSSVDASAHGFDGGLWVSEFGSRYLKCQQEAIDRNVRIRRVFILEDAETASDEAFRSVCRQQVELGIEVRVLPLDAPPTATAGLNDFILFDNAVSYEVTTSSQPLRRSGPPTIDKTRLDRGAKALKANADRFDALWQAAKPFEEIPTPRRSQPGNLFRRR